MVMDLMKSMSSSEKSRIATISCGTPLCVFMNSNSIQQSMRYSSAVRGERPLTTVR